MKSGLKNAWWVSFFELLTFVAMVLLPIVRWPWPARVPVHFDGQFRPNRWGSAWEGIVFIPIALMPLILSLVIGAIWSAQEQGRKKFNFIEVILSFPLGLVAGISLWFWWNIDRLSKTGVAPGAWWWAIAFALSNALSTAFLEWVRKPIPGSSDETSDTLPRGGQQVQEAIEAPRIPYSSAQRGRWMPILFVCVAVLLMALEGSILSVAPSPLHAGEFVPLVFAALMILFAMLTGSLHVEVTAETLTVRAGLLHARLLRLRREDLQSVVAQSFHPLFDFGGWGLRYWKGTWGYILRGNRGVRIETKAGKRYLISTDEPERLAAALTAPLGHARKD